MRMIDTTENKLTYNAAATTAAAVMSLMDHGLDESNVEDKELEFREACLLLDPAASRRTAFVNVKSKNRGVFHGYI